MYNYIISVCMYVELDKKPALTIVFHNAAQTFVVLVSVCLSSPSDHAELCDVRSVSAISKWRLHLLTYFAICTIVCYYWIVHPQERYDRVFVNTIVKEIFAIFPSAYPLCS